MRHPRVTSTTREIARRGSSASLRVAWRRVARKISRRRRSTPCRVLRVSHHLHRDRCARARVLRREHLAHTSSTEAWRPIRTSPRRTSDARQPRAGLASPLEARRPRMEGVQTRGPTRAKRNTAPIARREDAHRARHRPPPHHAPRARSHARPHAWVTGAGAPSAGGPRRSRCSGAPFAHRAVLPGAGATVTTRCLRAEGVVSTPIAVFRGVSARRAPCSLQGPDAREPLPPGACVRVCG